MASNPQRRRGAARTLAAAMAAVMAGPALAQAPVQNRAGLEQRVQRVERMVESSGMLAILDSVKGLQKEVRMLRGEIEVQSHAIEQLKQRQRELYVDLDRRLRALESAPASAPAAPGPSAAAPAPASAPPPAQAAGATASAPANAPAAAPASAAAVDPVAEQQAYQRAFKLLKDGRYEPAAESFREFLAQFSAGRYADNAQYWLGETYYGMRRYEDASREFQTLLARYPQSQKRPHAMLKLGYAQAELGRGEEARATLGALIDKYPKSTAAGLARKRLQRLAGG